MLVFFFKTEVIVNSISSDLELDRGPLSRALLKSAGLELQKELNRVGKDTTVDVGTVLQTSGCNLSCLCVLHVVAPDWRDDSASAHRVSSGLSVPGNWVVLGFSFHTHID